MERKHVKPIDTQQHIDINTYIIHGRNFWLPNAHNWKHKTQNWALIVPTWMHKQIECEKFLFELSIDTHFIIFGMRTIDEESGENQWKYRIKKRRKNIAKRKDEQENYIGQSRARLVVCVFHAGGHFFLSSKYVR